LSKQDVSAITALIERQFAALSWPAGQTGDWQIFAADFYEGAKLFPAARPLKAQSVAEFLARMMNLAGKEFTSLQETVLKTDIKVFGNIAIAAVLCAMTENSTKASQTVEMLLLVKDEGAWRIAAQAWDRANELMAENSGLFD
jgi:Putative lumazine-binding